LTSLLAFGLLNGCAKKTEAPAQAAAPVEITVEIFDRGTDGGKPDLTNNRADEMECGFSTVERDITPRVAAAGVPQPVMRRLVFFSDV
jgi:hypothetical protein